MALSTCHLELRPRSCGDDGGCGLASFHVTAITDFSRDGNRASLISAVPVAGVPRLWRNYVPKSMKVSAGSTTRKGNSKVSEQMLAMLIQVSSCNFLELLRTVV